jgi:hypothetical protein
VMPFLRCPALWILSNTLSRYCEVSSPSSKWNIKFALYKSSQFPRFFSRTRAESAGSVNNL